MQARASALGMETATSSSFSCATSVGSMSWNARPNPAMPNLSLRSVMMSAREQRPLTLPSPPIGEREFFLCLSGQCGDGDGDAGDLQLDRAERAVRGEIERFPIVT